MYKIMVLYFDIYKINFDKNVISINFLTYMLFLYEYISVFYNIMLLHRLMQSFMIFSAQLQIISSPGISYLPALRSEMGWKSSVFILFYFILFYFIYFILFYFIYFILFYYLSQINTISPPCFTPLSHFDLKFHELALFQTLSVFFFSTCLFAFHSFILILPLQQ